MIKLQHDRTKFRLHSHEVPYGSGSGQQSVTAFPGVEDGNSYWVSDNASSCSHVASFFHNNVLRAQYVFWRLQDKKMTRNSIEHWLML